MDYVLSLVLALVCVEAIACLHLCSILRMWSLEFVKPYIDISNDDEQFEHEICKKRI